MKDTYLALFSQFVEGLREPNCWNCGNSRHGLEGFEGNRQPRRRKPKTRTKEKMGFGFIETHKGDWIESSNSHDNMNSGKNLNNGLGDETWSLCTVLHGVFLNIEMTTFWFYMGICGKNYRV